MCVLREWGVRDWFWLMWLWRLTSSSSAVRQTRDLGKSWDCSSSPKVNCRQNSLSLGRSVFFFLRLSTAWWGLCTLWKAICFYMLILFLKYFIETSRIFLEQLFGYRGYPSWHIKVTVTGHLRVLSHCWFSLFCEPLNKSVAMTLKSHLLNEWGSPCVVTDMVST
jgi:hypothetical protein